MSASTASQTSVRLRRLPTDIPPAATPGGRRRRESRPARARSRAGARPDGSGATSAKAAARTLDRPSFAGEVLPYRDELYGAALRMTREPHDAEDLVQETMMRALTAWERFEPGSNCRAWLFRILINSFINNYRRRRRHSRFAHENPEDAVAAVYGPADRRGKTPVDELVENGLGDEVSAALDSLADEYRKVVELADLRGVRYRDIAETLRVPIGTVMSRLFRARRQLESMLEDFAANDYGIRRAA